MHTCASAPRQQLAAGVCVTRPFLHPSCLLMRLLLQCCQFPLSAQPAAGVLGEIHGLLGSGLWDPALPHPSSHEQELMGQGGLRMPGKHQTAQPSPTPHRMSRS